MTRFVITDPGAAHSAKNATAPGLPNQSRNHSGRNPMVGTNPTPEESGGSLAHRQAEGLRALATLIEQNPALADELGYALNMFAPLVNREPDPRVTLTAFHAAATTHGTSVSVINEPHGCMVAAKFGPVVVRMHAGADLMVGGSARYPHYEPLVIDDADGGER